jgi:hypothetical protein
MVPTRHPSDRNEKRSEEATRVFYGVETVINTVLHFIDKTNNKIDVCIDQTRPSLVIDIAVLKPFLMQRREEFI